MHPMHYPQDNIYMHLCELLNSPTVHRCAELGLLIDRCSIKDLQHFFPSLVHSIFGTGGPNSPACGWGLRTITGLTNAQEFDVLYSFFLPMGPMFRLCYRLLGEQIRFDVPVEQLPPKTAEMLFSGRYAGYYADAVVVDPAVRQVVALQLNAFDYYLLHFALHGMQPLHLQHSLAMDVHNEKRKTLYIFLVADYMCTFLPSHPEAVVMPSNVCGGGGGRMQSSVLQPIQPSVQHARSPKYLKLSALQPNTSNANNSTFTGRPAQHSLPGTPQSPGNHHHHHHQLHHPLSSPAGAPVGLGLSLNTSSGVSTGGGGGGSPSSSPIHIAADAASCWRTESTLHLFVDTWLRCDVTAHLHLPSSEFIRAVRICVKQLHAFANAADLDHQPAMAALRSAVPAMIAQPTYSLLRTLIRRWPMDSSFAVVLELWLSYVQPWRYSFERIHGPLAGQGGQGVQQPEYAIQRRFEVFVRDNLCAYTQILVQLMPLFERLNFGTLKNVLMMSRLLKVFAQANLAEVLRCAEFEACASVSFLSSPVSSPAASIAGGRQSFRQRSPVFRGGPPTPGSPGSQHHDASLVDGGCDSSSPSDQYVCLFGDEVQQQIAAIGRRMQAARRCELTRAQRMVADEERRQGGHGWLVRWLRWLVLTGDEESAFGQQLTDCRKIPELLGVMLAQLQQIFDVQLPEEMPEEVRDLSGRAVLLDETMEGEHSLDMSMGGRAAETSQLDGSGMLRPPNSITYTVDPAIVPAKAHELACLVRVLYELAAKLNLMFGAELEASWHRRDLVGRCVRQVLSAPLVVHSFDKSAGVSRVCEQRLGPRVNLRPLASVQALALVVAAFAFGWLWWGVPSFGFIGLLLAIGAYVLLMVLFGCGDATTN